MLMTPGICVQTIRELLDFVNAGRTNGIVSDMLKTVSETELRVIAFNLLGWLKFQARWRNCRPLELNTAYSWCKNLQLLLDNSETIGQVFTISEDRVDFRSEIDEETRNMMRAAVDRGYGPTIRPLDAT
jgi:hypothetical protein